MRMMRSSPRDGLGVASVKVIGGGSAPGDAMSGGRNSDGCGSLALMLISFSMALSYERPKSGPRQQILDGSSQNWNTGPMDLNALQDFVFVATHGGFAPASRAKGIPKSSLSRRVRELEERLGVRLLDRTA